MEMGAMSHKDWHLLEALYCTYKLPLRIKDILLTDILLWTYMLLQTKTHISEAPLCTHMLHLTKTHIVLRSQSPQVTNKLLFSGSSSPCCSIHAGNICQTTSSQWGWYRYRLSKDTWWFQNNNSFQWMREFIFKYQESKGSVNKLNFYFCAR